MLEEPIRPIIEPLLNQDLVIIVVARSLYKEVIEDYKFDLKLYKKEQKSLLELTSFIYNTISV